jgi:hypothetical protein
MPLLIVGAMVNSALYLAGLLIAGFVAGNDWAWKGAIAAAGITYLSYLGNIAFINGHIPEWAARLVTAASIFAGAAAGIALLF